MKTPWMVALAVSAASVAPCHAKTPGCGEVLDLYAECSAVTSEADRLVLTRSPASPKLQTPVCVDKRTALSRLNVLETDVQKLEDTGDLVVLTTIDSSRSMDLLEFSKKYIGQNMVTVKKGRVLRIARLGSLLPSGMFASGVASQDDAAALMNAIGGSQCSQGGK